jgi:hypothetical protein
MREGAVHECPGCGMPIAPGEDYVVAREYDVGPDFSLHTGGRVGRGAVERRFHVEHFRGRLGDHFYELIDERRVQ